MGRKRSQLQYEGHHVMWPKADYKMPLLKRVRNMGAYTIDATTWNHRLLHASMEIPPQPGIDLAYELQGLSVMGLETAISRLDCDLTKHMATQLEIVRMSPDEARERINTGEFLTGEFMRDRGNHPVQGNLFEGGQ